MIAAMVLGGGGSARTGLCVLRSSAGPRKNCAVRIAFSGSHRVGKSTLIERVAEALPSYAVVAEPYYLLEEEGYECSDPPSAEDFEAQLDRSIIEFDRPRKRALGSLPGGFFGVSAGGRARR